MRSRTCRSYVVCVLPGLSAGIALSWAVAFEPQGAAGSEAIRPASNHGPCIIGAGSKMLTYVDVTTPFYLRVIDPDGEVQGAFSWDFDGDGVEDWSSTGNLPAVHRFTMPGACTAVFRVRAGDGRLLAESPVEVLVLDGTGAPELTAPPARQAARLDGGSARGSGCEGPPGDGTLRRHIVIVNGAGEARFFDDVRYAYRTFHDVLGIPAEDIHVLNHDGTFGSAGDPEGIIDRSATFANLEAVCAEVAASADGDDLVGVWITDHGHGYLGPVPDWPDSPYLGYLDGLASVDPDDEQDCPEGAFKLRSFFTGGDYRGDHGMNVWRVYSNPRSATQKWYYRHEYASHFAEVEVAGRGLVSDADIYIEEFKDYLDCDADKDGLIDSALGEVLDCDQDGIPPYDPGSGAFDDGDWGPIDSLLDDVRYVNTQVPVPFGGKYSILDLGLDDRVDIDLDHDPAHPEANGTDLDGAGLFDGLDVNDDKDRDDWVSIDETFVLYGSDVSDDDLRLLLEPIRALATFVWMEQCFSGGFIEDLSRPDRILAAACEEDTVSYGNRFIRTALSAIGGLPFPESGGDPLQVDLNGDGAIDMVEVFNFSAANDYDIERPQYDDNGDGRPHSQPLPRDGDGRLGAWISAGAPVGAFVRGDGNDDGSIDVSDVVTIALYLFSGLEVRRTDALDFDDSGSVELADCIASASFLFQLGPAPPCPYPSAGIDLTP